MADLNDDLRVLVIADDPLARTGLATLLRDQPGCLVVGQAAGDDDLSAAVAAYQPDAILWDLGWEPVLAANNRDDTVAGTFDNLSDLQAMGLPLAVLIPDESYAAEVWAAGVRTILLRQADPAQLVGALQAAQAGLVSFDPALGDLLGPGSVFSSPPLVEELTPREQEVLQLLAEGLANKAIARRLAISEHTVKFHVNAIMGKLEARSRTEAVVRASRLGLILL